MQRANRIGLRVRLRSRYVPHYIDTTAGAISTQVLADLDALNGRIVEELKKEVGEGLFDSCTVGWFEPLVGDASGHAGGSTLLGGNVVETPSAAEDGKQLGDGEIEASKDGEWRRAVCVRIGLVGA